MEKKIVIAVEDSVYARRAVEYAVKMGFVIKDLHYVLFNVQPTISDYLLHDTHINPQARAALKDVIAKNQETSENLLGDFKTLITGKGIDEKMVETVTQPRVMGIAKDILNYSKQRLCDAILLGRRGVSKLEEAFMGSVSNTVIEHASTIPIWAVGGEVGSSSKIMLAIDGSESALRAVDHISVMIGDNADMKVTLLHVTPRLRDYCTIEFDEEGDVVEELITQGDRQCVESFYLHAQQRFREAGVEESQIDIREVQSVINVGKTIVDEVDKEQCGTLVLGSRGVSESFFLGGVSRYCFNKASNCAVWIVP